MLEVVEGQKMDAIRLEAQTTEVLDFTEFDIIVLAVVESVVVVVLLGFTERTGDIS